ncbi:MAG: hypothetical protein H6625_01730 [Bdellovibrionaceae bacterium]|nr:hypothetical protein [Pseudobdellovibrionaceae bacterium]
MTRNRKSLFIDKDFQHKYIYIALIGTLTSGLIGYIPLFYFINQNYDIFIELSYLNAPNIVNNLLNEKIWMNSLMLVSMLGQVIFIYIFMLKLTAKIVGPLKILKNHLKLLNRGLWNVPPIRIRKSDEFQDIIDSYNYFLQSFREDLKQDLDKLKNVKIDRSHITDYKNWQDFVNSRKQQLGELDSKSFVVVSDAANRDSRHVS